MDRPVRDWNQGDRFSASHLQEGVDIVRPLQQLWGDGIDITQFPEGTAFVLSRDGPLFTAAILRVQVTDLPDTTGGINEGVVLVKAVIAKTGNTLDIAEFPVRTVTRYSVGEPFYAIKILNLSLAEPVFTYPTADPPVTPIPIQWVELHPPEELAVKVISVPTPSGPEYSTAMVKRLVAADVMGEEFEVTLSRKHKADDIFVVDRPTGQDIWAERIVSPIWVTLSTSSGAAGDRDTTATWKYSAVDEYGTLLGTELDPEWAGRIRKMNAATRGWGEYNDEGVFVLRVAYETFPGASACTTEEEL